MTSFISCNLRTALAAGTLFVLGLFFQTNDDGCKRHAGPIKTRVLSLK